MPPTRTLFITKSAPSTASSIEVASRMRSSPASRATIDRPSSAMTPKRFASGSNSTISRQLNSSAASLTPKTNRGVRTPPPPITAILRSVGLLINAPELFTIRESTQGPGHARGQRTADAGAAQALLRGCCFQYRVNEPRIERIAAAGCIDGLHFGWIDRNCEAVRVTHCAARAQFENTVAHLQPACAGEKVLGRACAAQQCGFFLIRQEIVNRLAGGVIGCISEPCRLVANIQRARATRRGQRREDLACQFPGQRHREMNVPRLCQIEQRLRSQELQDQLPVDADMSEERPVLTGRDAECDAGRTCDLAQTLASDTELHQPPLQPRGIVLADDTDEIDQPAEP